MRKAPELRGLIYIKGTKNKKKEQRGPNRGAAQVLSEVTIFEIQTLAVYEFELTVSYSNCFHAL